MLRLGKLIWSHTRDMRVLNYPEVMVYEIYTNKGNIFIGHNKTNDTIERLNVRMVENLENSKLETNKSEKILLSNFK